MMSSDREFIPNTTPIRCDHKNGLDIILENETIKKLVCGTCKQVVAFWVDNPQEDIDKIDITQNHYSEKNAEKWV